MTKPKKCLELSVEDYKRVPIWEFRGDSGLLHPVLELPVSAFTRRIVGTELCLANRTTIFGELSNIELLDPFATEQFLAVSFLFNGKRFHLARYFDVAYDRFGPSYAAAFLGLPVADVFPITYDISSVAIGEKDVVQGVTELPRRKLSDVDRAILIRRNSIIR